MYNNLKLLKKNIYLLPFFCGFIYFLFIFIKVPIVADRWMEQITYYDLQDTWRVLFDQIRWMQKANARVFSNLLSLLFDKNVYVRAVLNALMMMAFCYLGAYGFRDRSQMSGRKRMLLSVLSVGLTSFVSWNIKTEVYLYATTLYLSSALVVLVNLILLFKCFYVEQAEHKYVTVLYIVQLGTLLWLENVSLVLAGVCTLNAFILYIKEHKINKKALASMAISIIGLLIMYIDVKIAAPGRFGGGVADNFDYYCIVQFVYDNIYVILILILLVNYLFHRIFKTGKMRMLATVFLDILSMAAVLLTLKNIYEIISAGLWIKIPYDWAPFRWQIVKDLFCGLEQLYTVMLVPVTAIFLAILIIVLYNLDIIYEGGAVLISIMISFAFQCMYFVGAGRIEFLTVFGLISMILLLAGGIQLRAENTIKKYVFGIVSSCILVMALIQFDSLYMFVHTQAKIEEERQHIAELVRNEQLLGRWDYSEIVIMPAFSETIDGRCLFSPNPKRDGVHYNIVLRYYDLDLRTEVIFE